jgi:predicted glycosyltransferase
LAKPKSHDVNILVDIGHPAHVHLFRNFVREAEKRGHVVTVFARAKEKTLALLEAAGIRYSGFTRAHGSFHGNVLELCLRDFRVWRLIRQRHIHIALGSSIPIAHATVVTGVKSYVFGEDDIDDVPLMGRLAYPFCTAIVTPRCVRVGRWDRKRIAYDGYQKLAYLHPNWFTPNPKVVHAFGIDPGKPYFLLRLTAFNAYHDARQHGLQPAQVRGLVNELLPHGRILINSEKPLPPEWEPYRLAIPPEHIHHLMAFARLFIGDGQSMTTESALLGVPAFRCNTFAGHCSVIRELEGRYGLVYSYPPNRFEDMQGRILSLLQGPDFRPEWNEKRERLLREKIDVTRWMLDFVEKNVPCVA